MTDYLIKHLNNLKDQVEFYENFKNEYKDYTFVHLTPSITGKFINGIFKSDQKGLVNKINKVNISNEFASFKISQKYLDLNLEEKIQICMINSTMDDSDEYLLYNYIYEVCDFLDDLKRLNLERFLEPILKEVDYQLKDQIENCKIPESIRKLMALL